MNKWLPEQLKTIKNLCITAEILIENKRPELLPTILEIIHLESQDIINENCIEDSHEGLSR